MLQTIREHTQGWIAGTIVSVIILTFALWGVHSYFVGGAGNNVVAEVNGVEITKEQLSVAYERLRRKVQIQYNANNPITAKEEVALKERALQALVEIEALKQASLKQGFQVSDNQVDGYLQSMPEFQVDGQFSMERFQEILAATMLSTSEFLELIKTSLLIDQPKLGLIFSAYALPDETKETIDLVNQERSIEYVNLPLQPFLAKSISISPEAIQAYYDDHKNDFSTPEQMNIEYLQLSLKDLEAKIIPTETGLKNLYNENINSYTQPMSWKLAEVEVSLPADADMASIKQAENKAQSIAELAAKSDLAKIGREYHANIQTTIPSAEQWITLNQVAPELQKAVAQLTRPNQVSEPIRTAKGFVVMKVLAIQEPRVESFESVKDKVKEAYIRQHAEEKFAEARDQLSSAAYEHPDSLQFAASALNLPIQTTELFTRDKPGTGITQSKKIRDVAFSNDVLNLQNNSDVIQVNPETLVVLRAKSHMASSLLPLNSVQKQIEEKLRVEAAEKSAEAFAQDLRKQLAAGASPSQLASQYHLTWNKTGYLGRYSTKVDSAILDLAFRMPNPKVTDNKIVYDYTRLPTGYALIAVTGVKDGAMGDKKQQFVFAEQVQNSQGLLEYELYKQSQLSSKDIKIEQ